MTIAMSAERLGPVGLGAAPIGNLDRPTWRVRRASIDRLSGHERDAILGGTADRVSLDPKVRSLAAR